MDIGILTTDAVLARFLCLELKDAGYTAAPIQDFSAAATLYLCDLDAVEGPYPENTVGFSSDERKASAVRAFLPRPIDALELRETVARYFPRNAAENTPTLRFARETRIVRGERGSVRLSQKEAALLLALADGRILTREAGAKLFGDGESNVVDVYVHYLRRKLTAVCGVQTIRAVRGAGYVLSEEIVLRVR